MIFQPSHGLLLKRAEVSRLHKAQSKAFQAVTDDPATAIAYDLALDEYVEAKIAYEAELKIEAAAYKASRKPKVEAHYGDPF